MIGAGLDGLRRTAFPVDLASPTWYRALSLAERAALPEPIDEAGVELGRGVERARHWREQSGLDDDDLLGTRLGLHDLNAQQFVHLLAESSENLRDRCPATLPWLRQLERAYRRTPTGPAMPLGEVADSPQAGFLKLVAPLMDDAYERLCRDVESLSRRHREVPFEPTTVAGWWVGKLPANLLFMVSPTLTLELRIASLEERLAGSSPEERFETFVGSLGDPATALGILSRYPVLARMVQLRLEQWRAHGLEFFHRLISDHRELGRHFGPPRDPGPLVDLLPDLSDRHHGGRSVVAVGFASGLRVVYKPRSLAAENAFQEVLAWLNERGQDPPLPTLRVLDRGGYGWAEYVDRRACTSHREVTRFYRRQGAYLALLYALEAGDFHYENLIARGENPVLIDLETLLQPRMVPTEANPDFAAQTVLRTKLLPGTDQVHGNGLEVSGLSSIRGQKVNLHGVDHPGTDRMQLTVRPTELPGGDNLPTVGEDELSPWEFREFILRGFDDTYRLLEDHRDDLLAPTGPLHRLASCDMRVLLRPTALYVQLLISSWHPDAAQDALVRDRVYDKLWLRARRHPVMARAVGAELAELAELDIPHFTASPDSRHLRTSSGLCVEDFFQVSGLEAVRQRLEGLCERDRDRQSYLIREALRMIQPADAPPQPRRGTSVVRSTPMAPEAFLDAALAIGRRLERLAVHQAGDVSWFHVTTRDGTYKQISPVGPDLYQGLAGITLFLAHLGKCSGEERFTALAQELWAAVRQRLESSPESLPGIGAFIGWGAFIYTSVHLGLLWNEPGLLVAAEEKAPTISARLESDEVFDLLGGAAGAILSLLALHRHKPADSTLHAAVACGEHLLRHGQRSARGLAWPSPLGADVPPLTGLAHGTAGIAWALTSLARESARSRFAVAAEHALAYERSWFSTERNNWPDLRHGEPDEEDDPSYFLGWCHGSPGIGLSRLVMDPDPTSPTVEQEVRAALISTRQEGFGSNHCLCHGDLGNLDLFHQAGVRWADDEILAEARQLAGHILAGIEQAGWRCGTGNGGEPPGLMTGLAGIGYGLLRAFEPRRVPSVLVLETPDSPMDG